jgi:hypothetical protein
MNAPSKRKGPHGGGPLQKRDLLGGVIDLEATQAPSRFQASRLRTNRTARAAEGGAR